MMTGRFARFYFVSLSIFCAACIDTVHFKIQYMDRIPKWQFGLVGAMKVLWLWPMQDMYYISVFVYEWMVLFMVLKK